MVHLEFSHPTAVCGHPVGRGPNCFFHTYFPGGPLDTQYLPQSQMQSLLLQRALLLSQHETRSWQPSGTRPTNQWPTVKEAVVHPWCCFANTLLHLLDCFRIVGLLAKFVSQFPSVSIDRIFCWETSSWLSWARLPFSRFLTPLWT